MKVKMFSINDDAAVFIVDEAAAEFALLQENAPDFNFFFKVGKMHSDFWSSNGFERKIHTFCEI